MTLEKLSPLCVSDRSVWDGSRCLYSLLSSEKHPSMSASKRWFPPSGPAQYSRSGCFILVCECYLGKGEPPLFPSRSLGKRSTDPSRSRLPWPPADLPTTIDRPSAESSSWTDVCGLRKMPDKAISLGDFEFLLGYHRAPVASHSFVRSAFLRFLFPRTLRRYSTFPPHVAPSHISLSFFDYFFTLQFFMVCGREVYTQPLPLHRGTANGSPRSTVPLYTMIERDSESFFSPLHPLSSPPEVPAALSFPVFISRWFFYPLNESISFQEDSQRRSPRSSSPSHPLYLPDFSRARTPCFLHPLQDELPCDPNPD